MHWTKPWCLRNSLAAEVSARREDAEKGFERIGRYEIADCRLKLLCLMVSEFI